MGKSLQVSLAIFFLLMLGAPGANAQMPASYGTAGSRSGMRGSAELDNHTVREEAEGKAVWEKLQTKELACKDLTDDNFDALGEYFMGQMLGTAHEAMNAMMEQMLGQVGEEQMHVVMGKRLSGCELAAAYPAGGRGFVPMMQMMMEGWSSPFGTNQGINTMMGNFGTSPVGWLGFGLGWLGLGWLFMIFWWLLLITGIVFLVRWLARQLKGSTSLWGKSALEILKERYAKGEITKHEYEEMKKEIAS